MKLIILDRDGVINYDSDDFIKSVDEFRFLPGSLDAMAQLSKAGYTIAVATNQSGIGRGFYDIATLEKMHDKLTASLSELGGKISMIAFCPHGPDDGCDCRKPKPGMYHQIAKALNCALDNVPVIGDSLRDLQAAQIVNAKPILVRTGKGERTLANGEGLDGIPVYSNLSAAVAALLMSDLNE
ncbi:MAG: D-glycero-beta-D-manno-heptose 1,7-bisphosphate 7-phosphatase [Gammaproteobacteria bacterium]|nr:D-glycero-beta-D-manno-heptose 1,7-bisphosphate 7-phosphatase [Gammaproteobacteria bacterium]